MWGSAGCDDEGAALPTNDAHRGGYPDGLPHRPHQGGRLVALRLTGNGSRQDYRSLPIPPHDQHLLSVRAHCTSDELIADTHNGLYAKSLSGGEVNPVTGDFVFGVEEGYLIDKGRVGAPVRGATLIGNGPVVLQGIDGDCRRPVGEGRHLWQRGAACAGGEWAAHAAHQRVDRGWNGPDVNSSRQDKQGRPQSPLRWPAGRWSARLGLRVDIEAYVEFGRTVSVKVFAGAVESASVAEPQGIGVRAIGQGKTGYAFSTDVSLGGGCVRGGRSPPRPRRSPMSMSMPDCPLWTPMTTSSYPRTVGVRYFRLESGSSRPVSPWRQKQWLWARLEWRWWRRASTRTRRRRHRRSLHPRRSWRRQAVVLLRIHGGSRRGRGRASDRPRL